MSEYSEQLKQRVTTAMTKADASVKAFNAEIMDFAKKLAPEQARTMQRKICLEGLKRLVEKTPVDTGRARGNWQVGINQDPAGQVDVPNANVPGERPLDKLPPLSSAGQEAVDAGAAVIDKMPLCTAYITNNLVYIEALEAGHSGQAPASMLALTAEELKAMFP